MEQTPEVVWKQCLDIIRDNVNRQSFKTWFEPLKPVSLEHDGTLIKLTIQLPSRFFYEWLEEHYFPLLRRTITRVLGPQGRLFYNIVMEQEDPETGHAGASMNLPARRPGNEPPAVPPAPPAGSPSVEATQAPGGFASPRPSSGNVPPAGAPPGSLPGRRGAPGSGAAGTSDPPVPVTNPFAIPGIQKVQVDSQLIPNYTFERYIEGDCNRLARSASLAIAENPGATSFNPFLVYGGVGLGKTHLIQAIGNYARANRKVESVLYVSSEQFTNEFVRAIQQNRANEFSLFYRQIDLLIVDDIQFFDGKEKTQEEFFHIFNALHQAGKQLVLSADRSPRDIQGIEERLLSRFQWGLSADVKPPDLETRIAILQRRAEDEGIEIQRDIIEFVAHNVTTNIRELEGALIRLIAQAVLRKHEIDLPLAKEVLRDLIKETRINLTIEEIQRLVCEYLDIPEDLVRAKTRKREVVQARQVAMYFCKLLTKHSLKTIGLHFGGRDHSTVIHAIQSVENQIETDPKFRDMIEEIRHRINLRSTR
ncbi:MAG: chromosomal replication initiator protein DnaA [Bacteroidetes bacterium]|nr:MAG: chromosomal replication initiator protein DnaA [Bacteroidota bacterium]